jgi:hypothetical protein
MSAIAGISHATTGIHDALDRVDRAAARVASPDRDAPDLTRSLVETKLATHQVAANVSVLHAADLMLGTVIDLFG